MTPRPVSFQRQSIEGGFDLREVAERASKTAPPRDDP